MFHPMLPAYTTWIVLFSRRIDTMRTLVILAAVIAVIRATGDLPPTLNNDFSANVTINQGGQILHGSLYWDYTGQRTYQWIQELNQSTYSFQPFGETTLYSFTMTTSGCTCTVAKSTVVTPMFGELATAIKSSKPCKGGVTGTLWENNAFSALQQAPQKSFCIDGTTPVYMYDGVTLTTFKNGNLGRSAPFPTEPLESQASACSGQCI